MTDNKKHSYGAESSPMRGNAEGKGGSIELRSGEVQEILGGVPSRLVRYGIYLFAVIFALIIVFSFVFSYPDILRSTIVVTTENPPATLVARATGKIDKLFVEDKDKVVEDQIIALIENTANYNDVLELKALMIQVQAEFDSMNFASSSVFSKHLQLGSVQEYYSAFLTKSEELREFTQRNFYTRKDESFQDQLKNARILYDRLWEQKVAVDKEYQLKQRNYERQKKLLAGEVVSSTVLEQAESEMLSKKSELDGLRSDLAQKQIDIGALEQRIIENEKEFRDYKLQYESAVLEAFNILRSEVSNWELTFLIRSPIAGTVSFNKFYAENQNITEGDRAFNVVPDNADDAIGKVELPIRGSGKVEPGLDVNVKFDNYPYMEFGMVRGKVKSKSHMPEDSFYMVEVEFPEGLVTNYGQTFPVHNQLTGQAEIITEDLKLIQRFFNPLKALWKERVQ